MGGTELRNRVALAQIGGQHLQQALHHVVQLQRIQRFAVHAGNHQQRDKHAGTQTLQIAHLQVVDFLEHGILAHKRAGHLAVLLQFLADRIDVHLQRIARLHDLLIKFLNALRRLHTQIAEMQIGHVLILHERFMIAAGFDQRIHQLQMQRLVKSVHVQRCAAHVNDLVIPLRRFQQRQILIDQLQKRSMQRSRTAERPLLLAALKQIAAVQAEGTLVVPLAFLRQFGAGAQALFQLFELIQVDADPRLRHPAVRAALGDDARRQRGTDLRQNHAQTADQRFQGAFRVAAALAAPQGFNQPIHRNIFAVLQSQKLQQHHTLAGLAHQRVHAVRAAINMKASQQVDTDRFAHVTSSFLLQSSYKDVYM